MLILAAMPSEVELIAPRLSQMGFCGNRPFWQGFLGKRKVSLVLTGLGVVNASQAVTAFLEKYPHTKGVINIGCAGSYDPLLTIGTPVLASQVVFADMGVRTANRMYGLKKIGISLLPCDSDLPVYNRLSTDKNLGKSFLSVCPNLREGVFATVCAASGDKTTALSIAERYQALLEDMESAACAQVAALYGKPFVAIRGVSNMAGHRELDVKKGADAAQKILLNWCEPVENTFLF